MSEVLHIIASPKGEHSVSRRLAAVFIDELQKASPEMRVRELALFQAALPEFGEDEAVAKFAPLLGQARSPAQDAAWRRIEEIIADFDRAERIIISAPMWNGGVPYKLKHYFDLIMQPRASFSYDPKKMIHFGLLRNRPVQLILTRSSIMPGDYADFQLPYLKWALNYIGLQDVRALTAWRTTQPTAEAREAYVTSFFEAAREAARRF